MSIWDWLKDAATSDAGSGAPPLTTTTTTLTQEQANWYDQNYSS